MALATFSAAMTNATDAQFRAWGKAISDSLQAVGIVKTADSGQINWAAVAAPTAINTKVGYEIYRFNDTIQSTAPVFIKLSFGSGGSSSYPSLWISVGTGSDGSGTLTGEILTEKQNDTGSAGSASTATTHYVSGSSNRFVIALQGLSSNYQSVLTVERTHNSSGSDTSDGVMVNRIAKSNLVDSQHYLLFSDSSVVTVPKISCLTPVGLSGAKSPDINLYPVRFFTPGEGPMSNCLVGYISGDFAVNSSYTVSVLGIDRTFRTMLAGPSSSGYGATTYFMYLAE